MIDIAGIVKQALNKEIAAGGVRPVSGGDINDAYLVTLADGQKVFLKVNTPRNVAFFSAEQEGLAAIRKTNAIGVPEVLASGVFTGDGPAAGVRSKQVKRLLFPDHGLSGGRPEEI